MTGCSEEVAISMPRATRMRSENGCTEFDTGEPGAPMPIIGI